MYQVSLLIFNRDNISRAYKKYNGNSIRLSYRARLVYYIFKLVGLVYSIKKIRFNLGERSQGKLYFNKDTLQHETHNIHNLPEIRISNRQSPRLNVLVPAFNIETISAGFFGVFAFAIFCAKAGYPVRLVLFESFHFDKESFRKSLKKFPDIDNLLDLCEICYIGDREQPLIISPHDNALATVWYSAYLADKIRRMCNKDKFIYLVQDYEPAFHPQNANFVLAHNSYDMPATPWFSTEPLKDFFLTRKLYSGEKWVDYCVYNNACSPVENPRDKLEQKRGLGKKSFVFYCRPEVHRNMFHLGALAIITAYERGVFNDGCEWAFHGIGIGDVEISLDDTERVKQMPRMPLSEYKKQIGNFDVGLSLMASPHPSLVPFDLAASGCLVVTNSFDLKNEKYFEKISGNIICMEPRLEELIQGIELAVKRSSDIDYRINNATIEFPNTWEKCWTEKHHEFINKLIDFP